MSDPTARWIDRQEPFEALVRELAGERRVALDTEFVRERTYFAELALMQLAWSGGVALVDTLAVDVRPLASLLASDTSIVMHAGGQDLEILERHCGRLPARYFDTQLGAALLGHSQASLARLLDAYLGVDLPKGHQLADWTRRPLDGRERRYAAADVEHLLGLHDRLIEALAERGRLGWVDEENARMLSVDRSARDPETAWWRLKGARKLKGRARHRAQALASWRERVAQERNLPTRFVLSDLALASIAARPPRDARDLARVRGLDTRRVDVRGLMDALRRAEAMSDEELRRPPRTPQQRANPAAVSLAQAWLGQLARDEAIDPSLLATREDVIGALTGRPSRLDAGWRHALAGARLAELLDGRAALRFRGERLLLEPWPPS